MAGYLQENNQGTRTKAVTVPSLIALRQAHEKITMLTCYDASFAALMDRCGVDVLLVGDSLGMVIQGHDTTVPVTVAAVPVVFWFSVGNVQFVSVPDDGVPSAPPGAT